MVERSNAFNETWDQSEVEIQFRNKFVTSCTYVNTYGNEDFALLRSLIEKVKANALIKRYIVGLQIEPVRD